MANIVTSFTDTVPKLDTKGVFELLQDPDTHAIVLLTICMVMYGNDTFTSDPILLYKWLEEDFGTELHEFNENKLQAAITILTTDFFYEDLQTFKSICKTLLSGDPGAYDDNLFSSNPTIPEILWGIYEVALMNDDIVNKSFNFNPNIKIFIDIILNHSAVTENNDQTDVIDENIKEIQTQFIKLGMKNIPNIPTIDFSTDL